jgi:hypothetical protein
LRPGKRSATEALQKWTCKGCPHARALLYRPRSEPWQLIQALP